MCACVCLVQAARRNVAMGTEFTPMRAMPWLSRRELLKFIWLRRTFYILHCKQDCCWTMHLLMLVIPSTTSYMEATSFLHTEYITQCYTAQLFHSVHVSLTSGHVPKFVELAPEWSAEDAKEELISHRSRESESKQLRNHVQSQRHSATTIMSTCVSLPTLANSSLDIQTIHKLCSILLPAFNKAHKPARVLILLHYYSNCFQQKYCWGEIPHC